MKRATPRTGYDSSVKESTNVPSNSSALSILLAYSPMIQMSDAFASGSSNSSRFAHSVGITPSYVDGYFRKMSCCRRRLVQRLKTRSDAAHLHDYDGLLNDVAHPRSDQL